VAETRYLTLAEALELHAEVMYRTGGEPQPPRTLDGLSSALNRAAAAGYYAGADLIGQTARLAVGVSRSQAFLDGNKRTGFFVAVTFLNLNGLRCTGDSLTGAMLLDELADPSVGDDEADERFEAWLREHTSS
jgi:prophage maintenance system killer protein